MNAKSVFSAFVLVWVSQVHAQDLQPRYDASTRSGISKEWDTSPAHWNQIITEQRNSGLRLGQSDFVVSGPIVDGIRRQRYSADRGLGARILGLPVVRLFVPQRMPSPPGGGGQYFAWGEKDRPWASTVSATPPGDAFSSAVNGPQNGLISVGW